MSNIRFFSEDTDFVIHNKKKIRSWIDKVIAREGNKHIRSINYIFCSDSFLLRLNHKYLNHSTLTDIITFDHTDSEDDIESDIYISIDRVKDNCRSLNIPLDEELARVMIHGILHLLGYPDKTEEEKKFMRHKENECLTLL